MASHLLALIILLELQSKQSQLKWIRLLDLTLLLRLTLTSLGQLLQPSIKQEEVLLLLMLFNGIKVQLELIGRRSTQAQQHNSPKLSMYHQELITKSKSKL